MIPLVLRTLLGSRSSGDTTHMKELHIGNTCWSVRGVLVTITERKTTTTKKNNGKNTLRVGCCTKKTESHHLGVGRLAGAAGCGGVSRVDEDRP